MSTLKPCAHCGGEAEMDTQQAYRALRSGNIGSAIAIYCLDCGMQVSFCREDHSGLETDEIAHMAMETWNRRPDIAPTSADTVPGAWKCPKCNN